MEAHIPQEPLTSVPGVLYFLLPGPLGLQALPHKGVQLVCRGLIQAPGGFHFCGTRLPDGINLCFCPALLMLRSQLSRQVLPTHVMFGNRNRVCRANFRFPFKAARKNGWEIRMRLCFSPQSLSVLAFHRVSRSKVSPQASCRSARRVGPTLYCNWAPPPPLGIGWCFCPWDQERLMPG